MVIMTMAELLQAPTEGYEDAIVVPEIEAANFEIKHGLLTLVQNKQFFGHDKEDPHLAHMPTILSLRRDRFKDLLRACPHHGFSELHQLDTFYNALNVNDQDSLNSAAGGNFLDKRPAEICLKHHSREVQSCISRSKSIVAKVSTSASTSGVSPDVAELKDMVRALLLDKQTSPVPAPAPVKAVEQSCVTCGGAHSYRNCPATDSNNYRDNIQEYVSQAAAANFNQGNSGYRPPPMANQIRPPGFPPMQHNSQTNNQNRWNQNQNRGNGYNQGQIQRPQVQQQAPMYQPLVNQHPAYQAPAHQASGFFSKYPSTQYDSGKKNILTCPYGTFALPHALWPMPIHPGTFQRLYRWLSSTNDRNNDEVFMDDLFMVFGSSFSTCLKPIWEKSLSGVEDTNLALNWEKSHLMVKEGFSIAFLDASTLRFDDIAKLPLGNFRDQRDVISAEKKILQRREALFLGRSLSV
ncbi:hypothetical protein Tco_0591632 [Tanacetum coccineum]